MLWGIFDISGKQILPVEYDTMGCILGTQSNKINNNVLIIPEYEAIVVGKGNKYGIVSSLGKEYVPIILDSVYSITTSGEDKYYMTFTIQQEENGKIVDKQENYDIEQYFNEHVIQKPQNNQVNSNQNNTSTNQEEMNMQNNTLVNAM